MAAVALLIAASISAQPPQLILGKDSGADLEVEAPSGAKVAFSTSVGTITGAQRQGSVVRARFNAPPLRVPSVALVLAQIDDGNDRELRWLSIPLTGSDTMVIETRPGAKVEAVSAGRVLGQGSAQDDGTVRLPMLVPPGVRTAVLKITDKLGNTTEKPLDLAPPPFSRVRLAARSETAPIEVEIFVVKPDGTPDDEAKVALTAADGETSMRKRIGPGVYLAEHEPPAGRAGTAHLEAKANGQLATLEVPIHAAPAGARQGRGSGPWAVSAGLLGGLGGAFVGATAGSILAEIAMRIESYPVEALLDLGWTAQSEISQYTGAPALTEKAKAHAWLAQIGARGSHDVMRRLAVHGSLAFGLQNQNVRITLPQNLGSFEDSGLSARLAIAAGVNYSLGPGRALAQVQLDWTSKRVAQLESSTSGLQGMVGYLVFIR
jgi:hypothetical protein